MPFRSEKQRRYLWKNHPKIARDWTDEHGSKPQPKKRGGGVKVKKTDPQTRSEAIRKLTKHALANSLKNKDRLSVQDIKRAEEATQSFKQKKNALKGTKEALKIIKKKPELVGPEKGTKQAKVDAALEKYKNLTEKQRIVVGLPPREKKEDYPSYLKGKEKAKEHREKLKKLLRKGTGYVEGWLGKKQGGRVKKRKPWGGYNPETDQPRPRPNPFGKKKKKHHFQEGGLIKGKPKLAKKGWK